ncbi:MAG: response regulator transcription factor [Enterocloster sp.]
MFQILVVEDDKNTRKLMEAVLKAHGFQSVAAGSGLEALDCLDRNHIDLILLDIMMPDMDGYELTRQLRASNYNLPILMVTAKQLPEDKRRGFIVGTDDYMTKPVDEEEMILRIKALLRRARIADDRKITIGDVTLDYDSLTVSRKDAQQTLPRKEFYLLYKLLSYPGKIFTRMQLMDEIWGMESRSDDNTINVHINRLRKRFEDYPEFSIETIRGLGYKAVKHQ